jgi:hypothetical protein
MLDAADRYGFRFDTVQMPLNPLDAFYESFEKQVLPRLIANEIGVLGMKPMSSGNLLKTGAVTAIECLHYAMSLPTSVVITGCDSMSVLNQAFHAARTFRPLNDNQMDMLRSRTVDAAKGGGSERYKTTEENDSTTQNPQWLGPPPGRKTVRS